jgi:hypothetical protein
MNPTIKEIIEELADGSKPVSNAGGRAYRLKPEDLVLFDRVWQCTEL